jgi:hypothetical protein
MTCKHRYEATSFASKWRDPKSHWWSCTRCGHTIFATLKENT